MKSGRFLPKSCADYHFKPLKRLLNIYIKQATSTALNLSDHNIMFKALKENSNIVAHYFDCRTTAYFKQVMGSVFGVYAYWYRQEFAISRDMSHWHGLYWKTDRDPHNLLYNATHEGFSGDECAQILSDWATKNFQMTANHPAGQDENDNPKKQYWPPPEGTAPAPPENANPLLKLLMDVSTS